jgi:hypothetical protein
MKVKPRSRSTIGSRRDNREHRDYTDCKDTVAVGAEVAAPGVAGQEAEGPVVEDQEVVGLGVVDQEVEDPVVEDPVVEVVAQHQPLPPVVLNLQELKVISSAAEAVVAEYCRR